MAKNESVKEKVTAFLQEDNHFTRGLAFVEQKTGVNRLYLFGGKKLRAFNSNILY